MTTRATPRATTALMAILGAVLAVPAGAQAPPSPARIAELSEQWVDPVTDAPPVGWYVNSNDGRRPVEDVVIKDLIPHTFLEVTGVGHFYKDIVGGLGDEGFAFWREAFKGAAPASR